MHITDDVDEDSGGGGVSGGGGAAVRRADRVCGGEWSGARGGGPAARPSIKYSIAAPPAVYRRRSRDSRHSYRAPPSFQNGRHPMCVEREAAAAAVYEKARENRGKTETKYICTGYSV